MAPATPSSPRDADPSAADLRAAAAGAAGQRTPDAPARPAESGAPAAGRPLRVLVATGPTREPLDQVRYIGNRSSGRMGAAIAEAFSAAGCQVTVLVGPGAVVPQGAAAVERFSSAESLLNALQAAWPAHDLLIMAAAVADYRPAAPVAGKMRRESGPLRLELVPTQDILAGLASHTRPDQYVVGFALEEAAQLEASAAQKLAKKRADAIVANPLETMDADQVHGRVLMADGTWHQPPAGRAVPKPAFAAWLRDLVLPLATARAAAQPAGARATLAAATPAAPAAPAAPPIPAGYAVRLMRQGDFPAISAICAMVYPTETPYTPDELAQHLARFPQGQFVVEHTPTGQVAGVHFTLQLMLRHFHVDDSWDEFTARGTFADHDPAGHTLYGADLFVHPAHQHHGLGRWLTLAARDLVVQRSLWRMVGGSRMPGYGKVAGQVPPDTYIAQVKQAQRVDPVLTVHIHDGWDPVTAVRGYLPHDEESAGWAAVIQWVNAACPPPPAVDIMRLARKTGG